MEGFRYLEGVSSVRLDEGSCTGCRMCMQVCPHGVFSMGNGKARIADRDLCMECGACAKNCPGGAISVNPGVGCAAAVIAGWISRSKPACSC